VYKGDSNAASSSAGNPAEQVLAEELYASGGPDDDYSTDSSLSREMRTLGPAIEDVDLSDTEDADGTVVEVEAVDVTKTSTNKPSPLSAPRRRYCERLLVNRREQLRPDGLSSRSRTVNSLHPRSPNIRFKFKLSVLSYHSKKAHAAANKLNFK